MKRRRYPCGRAVGRSIGLLSARAIRWHIWTDSQANKPFGMSMQVDQKVASGERVWAGGVCWSKYNTAYVRACKGFFVRVIFPPMHGLPFRFHQLSMAYSPDKVNSLFLGFLSLYCFLLAFLGAVFLKGACKWSWGWDYYVHSIVDYQEQTLKCCPHPPIPPLPTILVADRTDGTDGLARTVGVTYLLYVNTHRPKFCCIRCVVRSLLVWGDENLYPRVLVDGALARAKGTWVNKLTWRCRCT